MKSDGGYYLTAAMLRKRGACERQVELFVRTFGKGRVLVNLANVKKAMAAGLDVKWPARRPWVVAYCYSESVRAAFRLYGYTRDAETPTQILACLNAAPRIWRMIDAERAKRRAAIDTAMQASRKSDSEFGPVTEAELDAARVTIFPTILRRIK